MPFLQLIIYAKIETEETPKPYRSAQYACEMTHVYIKIYQILLQILNVG